MISADGAYGLLIEGTATSLLDAHDLGNYLSHSRPGSAGTANARSLVRTKASGDTTAFKQQIDQQLAGALPLPDGPIGLHIGFRVAPGRNWANLWKPTIDSLLGRTTPHQAFHPRDGRIIELGLSNHIDPTLGHDVVISISASQIPG